MSVAAIPIDEELYSLDGFVQWIDRAELRLDNGDEWQLEPFQREIMADLLSMPRELWVIIPEGNAKTTLAAGAGLFFGDIAQNPWIPIGAASREQAEIMFGQMSVFVEGSDYLKGRFRVYNGYRKISCPGGGRGIKVYPWDPKTGDGVIPYPISLVDELHRHEDLRLYRLWKGKSLKRGASIITTSTAGEPGSEFEEVREAIRAKAGSRKRSGCHLRAEGDGLIYHEWMVPSSDQAKDLKVVKKANPLAQIDIPMLKDKLNSLTLDFGEDWLRLTCNIPSRSGAAAIPEADWDACGTDDEIPAGVPIGVGADFAWLLDTTALVPLWMRDSDYRLFGDPEILVPPRDGTMLAVEDVREAFLRIHERNPISYVVMDMTKAEDTAAWLESELHVQIVERPQRNELFALDYERFMSALAKRQLRHTRHPVFRQHCMNAIARKMPGDRYRFDRPSTSRNTKANRQERRVIDALVAACFVHTMATEGIDSVYEQRGLVTLSLCGGLDAEAVYPHIDEQRGRAPVESGIWAELTAAEMSVVEQVADATHHVSQRALAVGVERDDVGAVFVGEKWFAAERADAVLAIARHIRSLLRYSRYTDRCSEPCFCSRDWPRSLWAPRSCTGRSLS